MTVSEAARAIGVSESHLRRMLPELPCVRLRNRVVLPVDALKQWLCDRVEVGVAEDERADRIADAIVESLGDE